MSPTISSSVEETKTVAAKLASKLQKNNEKQRFICLYGDLGSGKTVFSKGFIGEMGIAEKEVKSPTYTFVRQYKIKGGQLYHFDFYRIQAIDDLMKHDLDEIFSQKNVWIIIEWPEHIESILPKNRTNVRLEYKDENRREITIS